jgi:hypothetical protein
MIKIYNQSEIKLPILIKKSIKSIFKECLKELKIKKSVLYETTFVNTNVIQDLNNK